MLRRTVFFMFGIILAAGTVLVFWQPDIFKREALNRAAEKLLESTAYEVKIGRVSGNLLTGFTLGDVRLATKPEGVELLRATEIKIGIRWAALLLHRTLQFQSLDWVKLANLGNGKIAFQGQVRMKPVPSVQIVLEDDDVPLEKLLAVAYPVPGSLRLIHSGKWTLQTDSHSTTLGMKGRLADAPISLEGARNPDDHYRADFTWANVAFNRLWPTASMKSGTFSASFDVFGKGLWVSGKGKITTRMQEDTRTTPWAQADVRLSRGIGTFGIHVGMADTQAAIDGKADLLHESLQADYRVDVPRIESLAFLSPSLKNAGSGRIKLAGQAARSRSSWRVEGHGTGENVVWQNALLNKIDVAFSLTPRRQRWDLGVTNLQFQKEAPKPADILSGQFSGQGQSPDWQSTSSLQFRDGSSIELRGVITREPGLWQWAWQRLVIAFPSGGSWTTARPGTLMWRQNHQISVHNLVLTNGTQSLSIRQGVLDKDFYRFDFSAEQLDPAPWAKLFVPEVEMKGSLNASLQIHDAKSQLGVEGFVNGKFPSLTVAPIGLAVKDIDMELRSSGQKLEVLRFVGKTKKGDIQLTGGSQLPQLDYSFHARKLALTPSASCKGLGDVDLHLGGTVESPVLTGRLGINEAAYAVPKKEQKKKASEAVAASSSTTTAVSLWKRGALDIGVQWTRDVWYRDGVSSIETHGDLRIQKPDAKRDLILTGTIGSVRGSYSYYGRPFTIESGEIQFAGTPELNPQLKIETSYANGPSTVYLDITGTAKQPVIKMHSNPPLSDQDIVSVIVFGQPLNELRSRTGGPSSNQEMMQAVGGVLGSYVSKGLNQTGIPVLNFDLLNIQPTDEGGSQLTAGRYLTRKLFISYGQSVQGSAEKSLTADYFLTDKWTLQGASDSVEGNYLDFLFRYPLNKPGAPANNSPLPTSPFRNSLDQPAFQPQFRVPMQ